MDREHNEQKNGIIYSIISTSKNILLLYMFTCHYAVTTVLLNYLLKLLDIYIFM